MRKKPVVIAHRGACGYLPEHTLPCKAAAHIMDPDFIEQDVVITADERAVVIHDHHLDTVTDAELVFPEKRRDDGHFYAIDFTLEELKKLKAHERVDPHTNIAAFHGRFPLHTRVDFRIHTLEEEIELILGMNRSRKRNIGIYTEFKAPRFHMEHGMDIARICLEIMAGYGYNGPDSNCFVQCFDPECIRHMKEDLKSGLRMIQLIADNAWNETPGVDYNVMLTAEGLDTISRYCDGIGPWIEQVIAGRGPGLAPEITDLVRLAHERGLLVHPYTVRADALPDYAESMDDLFKRIYIGIGIDGVFTDFPDMAVDFLKRNGLR